MKKLFAITTLAVAATSASALDFTVLAGRSFGDTHVNDVGLTVSQSMGAASLGLGYNRTAGGDQNRFSLVGGYQVAKLGSVAVTPTVGVSYLHNKNTDNGMAVSAGVELSMPVYKKVELVLDYSYQMGQKRVSQSAGNNLALGIRVPF